MTNLQSDAPRRITRDQALFWGPCLIGLVGAAAAAGLLLWPVLERLMLNQQQLSDLREQDARLPLLRAQLGKVRETAERARQHRAQVLQLIAGSGEISTFMAQLGREAQRTGVQVDGYEPVTSPVGAAGAPPPAPAATGQTPPAASPAPAVPGKPPASPADPLLAPGLASTRLLITARGSGPQLQDFLRGIERLNLMVVQSNLAIKHEQPDAKKPGFTTLRLNLALYSKSDGQVAD